MEAVFLRVAHLDLLLLLYEAELLLFVVQQLHPVVVKELEVIRQEYQPRRQVLI